jgi:hypothetical protein
MAISTSRKFAEFDGQFDNPSTAIAVPLPLGKGGEFAPTEILKYIKTILRCIK